MRYKWSTMPVDFYVTLAILIGSLYFLVDGLYISKLNAVAIRMPGLVLGLTVILCTVELICILVKFVKGRSKTTPVFEDKRNFIVGISMVGGYCLGLWLAGFVLTTIVTGIAYGQLYHYKRKSFMVLYTVAVTLVIYGIFVKVLNVPLPQGLLFQWI